MGPPLSCRRPRYRIDSGKTKGRRIRFSPIDSSGYNADCLVPYRCPPFEGEAEDGVVVYLSNAPSVRVESFSLADAAGMCLRRVGADDPTLFRAIPSFHQAFRLQRAVLQLQGNTEFLTTGTPRLWRVPSCDQNSKGVGAPASVDWRGPRADCRRAPQTEVFIHAE